MSVKRLLLMSGACGVLATAVSNVLAQENTSPEVVIVTGSYIRGTAEDAALPVDVISAEDLAKQGAPSTLEMLKTLSVSAGVLGDTNQFDARAQGSEGSGSVNLRGFGPQRTLVLMNGRRMVNNPFSNSVDTNLIPSAAIGRIEVLKDGAAATYGSDAIGGVVNFITNESLRGFQGGVDYKAIEDSDGDYSASLAYGWGNDRSSMLLAAGYQHRSELLVKDRDWATRSYYDNPQGGYSAAGNPSPFIPFGVTAPSPANPIGAGATVLDPNCAVIGGVVGVAGATPVCRWQYTKYDALTEEEDRWQAYAEYNLDIGETNRFHVEALYAETEVPIYRTSPSYAALQPPTQAQSATFPTENGTSPVGGRYVVLRSHPAWPTYLPTAASGALIVANRPYALGGNPLFNYGSSEGPREYDGFRVSASLKGELSEAFGWDVGVTYMEENASREARDTVVNRYQMALLGLGGPGCGGTTPGANGCLYYNPFSSAIPGNPITGQVNPGYNANFNNTNTALNEWMFPKYKTEQSQDLIVVDAVLNGTTGIDLPGGAIAWAGGVQYRDTTFKTDYDDIANFAVTPCIDSVKTTIVGPSACTAAEIAAPTGALLFLGGSYNVNLSQDVKAVFGELSLPITDSFQGQLAVRYEDYGSLTGDTVDPKLSLRWQLFDALALRGSVGTTFRGPTAQNVAPQSVTTLQDVRGTFRAIRTFGTPGLEPESAFTFNVGAIVKAGGFTGSVDYWSFDFEKPIVVEPLGALVDKVFSGAGGSCTTDPALASLVARFAFQGGVCAPANIQRIDLNTINGPDVKTDGIDLNSQFEWDLFAGTATIGLGATYIMEYNVDQPFVNSIAVGTPFDAAGQLNYQTTAYPLPKLKGTLFAEFSKGIHNIRYQLNYTDDYIDQRNIFAPDPNVYAGTPATIATATPFAVTAGRHINHLMTHELHYLVQLPWEVSLNASVENLTDEDPPFVRLDLSYDPFTASNAYGRTFKVGLRKRFGQ